MYSRGVWATLRNADRERLVGVERLSHVRSSAITAFEKLVP
jgi:hypothetical protein